MNLGIILFFYLCFHLGNILLLKFLAISGVESHQTLFFRGLGCLFLILTTAWTSRTSLVPNKVGKQVFRLVLAGVSLSLILEAYQYANATTVSLIQKLDIALLVILGPLIALKSNLSQRVAASLSLVAVILLGVFFRGASEEAMGYILAGLGTIGITFGFVFLKSSSKTENDLVNTMVPALAITLYGLGIGSVRGEMIPEAGSFLSLSLLSGGLMFGIYRLTIALYRRMDIAKAEYPTLWVTLAVMPLESLLFGIKLDPIYVGLVVFLVFALGLTVFLKEISKIRLKKTTKIPVPKTA